MKMFRTLLAGVMLACLVLPGIAKEEAKMMKISGIDVILRRTTANEVISAMMFIKGGSSALTAMESPAIEGMSLNVAAESGSSKYSKDEYQHKLAAMVSSIAGGGGRDYSKFDMRCVREHFHDTWKLFTDVITSPAFDSMEAMKDKRNSITAIKSLRSNPDAFVQYLADSVYFGNNPYARRPTVEEVSAITINDLKKHFADQFVKARLLLVVVGNVKEDELKKEIESTLATLPAGNYVAPKIGEVHNPKAAVVANKNLPTTYLLGGYAAPNRRQNDYWAMVMATTTLNDRLFEEVRSKRNLSYAPSAGLRPDEICVGFVYVSTTLPDSAIRVIYNCIDSLKNVPMQDNEVKSQVAQFITNIYLRDETNQSQAEALGRYQLMCGSWEKSDHVVEQLQKITPVDIQSAAKNYMHNFSFAAVGKADKIDKSLLESR